MLISWYSVVNRVIYMHDFCEEYTKYLRNFDFLLCSVDSSKWEKYCIKFDSKKFEFRAYAYNDKKNICQLAPHQLLLKEKPESMRKLGLIAWFLSWLCNQILLNTTPVKLVSNVCFIPSIHEFKKYRSRQFFVIKIHFSLSRSFVNNSCCWLSYMCLQCWLHKFSFLKKAVFI